jgi:hypothetical protein
MDLILSWQVTGTGYDFDDRPGWHMFELKIGFDHTPPTTADLAKLAKSFERALAANVDNKAKAAK